MSYTLSIETTHVIRTTLLIESRTRGRETRIVGRGTTRHPKGDSSNIGLLNLGEIQIKRRKKNDENLRREKGNSQITGIRNTIRKNTT